ncbi:transcriptional regulator [Halobiforma lacisalsi AJ5]|uniref:Transcriptional regulator n=1 Tax=Natronobacterium lacisalsi AJ5 TaxID=358396 RepID=M0L5Z8_NATLA|nr:helix-turn-helix domain-containing protein [Halobiforma lacisalsi]APW96310.1 transcriptional regulator [Halobiforma lacisalsi AJ5]EMA27420.1 MarR family transcriptional regulator [Halobiforma lacisalsi AJ5]
MPTPGWSTGELDPSTVSHHLSSLEEDGLVVRERDGPAIVNRVAPEVEPALERAEPAD